MRIDRAVLYTLTLPLIVLADDAGLGTFSDIGTGVTNAGSSPATPVSNPWSDAQTSQTTQNLFCSPKDYLIKRPDVKSAGVDVVTHFVQYGKKEGMCYPQQCTDAEYLRERPDVAAARVTAKDHFSHNGLDEGMCEPTGAPTRIADGLLNAQSCTSDEYLALRPDVKAANKIALTHYREYGKAEGMCIPSSGAAGSPSNTLAQQNALSTCTASQYMALRPDVAASGMSAANHYAQFGKNEGMCNPNVISTSAPPTPSSPSTPSSPAIQSDQSTPSSAPDSDGLVPVNVYNIGDTMAEVAQDLDPMNLQILSLSATYQPSDNKGQPIPTLFRRVLIRVFPSDGVNRASLTIPKACVDGPTVRPGVGGCSSESMSTGPGWSLGYGSSVRTSLMNVPVYECTWHMLDPTGGEETDLYEHAFGVNDCSLSWSYASHQYHFSTTDWSLTGQRLMGYAASPR